MWLSAALCMHEVGDECSVWGFVDMRSALPSLYVSGLSFGEFADGVVVT